MLNLLKIIFLSVFLFSLNVIAQSSSASMKDYYQYLNQQGLFEKQRNNDRGDYQKEQRAYQEQLEKARLEYVKNRGNKTYFKPETEPAYKEYLTEKRKSEKQDQQMRSQYIKNKQSLKSSLTDKEEMVQLGLLPEKERYNYKERQIYGGGKKYSLGSGGSSGSSGGGGSMGGSGSSGGGGFRPSAPDEFEGEDYEDDEDIPPPPPPPPPSSFDGVNGADGIPPAGEFSD